jgi:chromosome partitioning protein
MQIVAMAARKGGCGKTTLTTHLAVAAVQDGLKVAIIDLDPQATASEWADGRGEDPPDVISTQPARLEKVLDGLRGEMDLVIIDTPPTTGEADLRAIAVADIVLIPSRIQTSDISAVLRSHEKAVGHDRPAYVIFNDEAPSRRKSVAVETGRLLESKNIAVSPHVVHSRISFGESQDISKTALETEPMGAAADEIRTLYGWLKQQLNLTTVKPALRKIGGSRGA